MEPMVTISLDEYNDLLEKKEERNLMFDKFIFPNGRSFHRFEGKKLFKAIEENDISVSSHDDVDFQHKTIIWRMKVDNNVYNILDGLDKGRLS